MASSPVPFIGASYNLASRKADVQRTMNMCLKKVESGNKYILEAIPSGYQYAGTSAKNSCRGVFSIQGGRAFFVLDDTLYEVTPNVLTSRGTLATSSGMVSAAIGRTQAVIVDGTHGYVLNLATNVFTQITDVDFFGSETVTYIGGRFVFIRPGTDQFYWSAIDDGLTFDALDFATAESSPDGLVGQIVYREELWLAGDSTFEVWRLSQSADQAFEKNQGVSISVGLAAVFSLKTMDNTIVWVGQDENGGAVVYQAAGYSPKRISKHTVEEKMQGIFDPVLLVNSVSIEDSVAYNYQLSGQVFYCLNVPGLESTWCYEQTTDTWDERGDLIDGDWTQKTVNSHVYFDGLHLFGHSDSGIILAMSKELLDSTDVFERISPHFDTPSQNRVFFDRFRLNFTMNRPSHSPTIPVDPQIELYYSNNGGLTWSDSMPRSMGLVGDNRSYVEWNRLGSSKDRVWKIRCTGQTGLFGINEVDIQSTEGSS